MRRACFRQPVQAERTHEPIDRQGVGPDQFREPARADPTLQLHLPQAILGMDEAQREHRIVGALRDNPGNAEIVAGDHNFRFDPGKPQGAVGGRQRRGQPYIAATGRHNDDDDQQDDDS